ncbi:Protein-lysine N-methyltransferase rrg1 [Grifola frondosa]|uniref:Protein-lysine N-methyltransferase rrg1 n=1 Tax=Grifola frondosa TaxID=5627 RepID=A0A1C7MK70_GRIFR|nr:Protein-lysine N-methyltransferase rrg1 [Grifola frondosa]
MTVLSPPTSYLPPIGQIHQFPIDHLSKAVHYLRVIYNPEVRGTRRIKQQKPSKSSPASPANASTQSDLDLIRADAFERSYAIRWLTALVSQAYRLPAPTDVDVAQDALIHSAAALLALCAGTAAAGTLAREFSFAHATGALRVQLTDAPLENQDYASVGAQTWGSACLLAEMLAGAPADFGLTPHVLRTGLRALELGAGTGLVSIALAKIWTADAQAHATVAATDFHPSVLANLQRNIAANFPAHEPRVALSAHFLDWSAAPAPEAPPPLDEPFDLVLGADVVYEPEHARWIKACVERLLRAPGGSAPTPRFHLVIPLRPRTPSSRALWKRCSRTRLQSGAWVWVCGACAGDRGKEVVVCEDCGDVRSRAGGAGEIEFTAASGWSLDAIVHQSSTKAKL